MLERILILIFFVATLGMMYWAWRRWVSRHVERLASAALPPMLDELVPAGRPAVLYFTSDGCVQCKLQQTPVLQRFMATTGISVYPVDALTQTELARFFAVMTVPTTVVLDSRRRPRAINYGLAPLQKLEEQVRSVDVGMPERRGMKDTGFLTAPRRS